MLSSEHAATYLELNFVGITRTEWKQIKNVISDARRFHGEHDELHQRTCQVLYITHTL